MKTLLLLVCIFHYTNSSAQIQSKEITLVDSTFYSPYIGAIEPLIVVSKWTNTHGEIDSILWETALQPNLQLLKKYALNLIDSNSFRERLSIYKINTLSLICKPSDTTLKILQYKSRNHLHIELLKRYNSFLKKDLLITYPLDSLDQNKGRKLIDQHINTITLEYNHCIENTVITNAINLALIPFKTPINYNDPDLAKNYLVVSKNKSRVFVFDSSSIYIFQNRISPVFESHNIKLKVLEQDQLHTDQIENRIQRKSTYLLGDTVFLKSGTVVFDSISLNGNHVFFQRIIGSAIVKKSLPRLIFKSLKPKFGKKTKYLVVDFWGTWCTPCIEAFPELKKFQKILHTDTKLISVLWDKPEKKYLANKLLKKNNIKWEQVFNNMTDTLSLTAYLKINAFPSYVLINEKGEILFQDFGEDGFTRLSVLLNKLHFKKL